jgi:hypothetical protein
MTLFFLSYTHTHDRSEIVPDNEEKSSCRSIAPTCLADERCQRPTERERDKYQKNDRKTTTTKLIHRGSIKKIL